MNFHEAVKGCLGRASLSQRAESERAPRLSAARRGRTRPTFAPVRKLQHGFTLIEVLVIVAVIVVVYLMIVPAGDRRSRDLSRRIKCVSNLKNVGLAFRIFATDHEDRFPMNVSTNERGSAEYTNAALAQFVWAHYAVMSNELSTPKIIFCPDDRSKTEATNWTSHLHRLKNKATSYFVGYDADETRPQSLLSGDRNVTNDLPTRVDIDRSEVIRLGTNHVAARGAGWSKDLHQHQGNIVLGDGSVQQVSTARLREQLKTAGGDNLIGFPGQSPK